MAEFGRPKSQRQAAEEAEMRVGWRMAGIGFQVTSEVVAGILLGWLFDLWRGKGNTGVVVGSVVGIAVALWTLLRTTLKLNRELDLKHPTAGRGKPIPPAQPLNQDQDQDDDGDDWNDDKWNDDEPQPRGQRDR